MLLGAAQKCTNHRQNGLSALNTMQMLSMHIDVAERTVPSDIKRETAESLCCCRLRRSGTLLCLDGLLARRAGLRVT